MPAGLLTDRQKWVSLECDADVPKDQRPEFRVRPLTVREREAFTAIVEEAADEARAKFDNPDSGDAMVAVVQATNDAAQAFGARYLTSWRNLRTDDPAIKQQLGDDVDADGTIPFREETKTRVLTAILSDEEAAELARKLKDAYRMTGDERGNSRSPAPSQQANFASVVGQPDTAPTSQATHCPSPSSSTSAPGATAATNGSIATPATAPAS